MWSEVWGPEAESEGWGEVGLHLKRVYLKDIYSISYLIIVNVFELNIDRLIKVYL